MSTGVLLAVVIPAALACPAHMWWQARRGRQPACCPPQENRHQQPANVESLRRRHAEITRQIDELEAASPHQHVATRD